MLSYVSPQHMPYVAAGLRNARQALATAKENGVITHDNVAEQIIGTSANVYGRAANAIARSSGTQAAETAARVIGQAMGESVARVHVTGARAGDKTSIAFLENLGADWQHLVNSGNVGIENLGSRIAKLAQGSYDMSNLPSWTRNSSLSAFVPLARWSIEQSNNFKKLALDPLRHGDAMPLISHLLVGLGVGGAGLAYVKENLSGKKAYEATMKEIENAPNKDRANEALASKLAAYAQLTGTGGIAIGMAKAGYDMARGTPASPGGNPTLNLAGQEIDRVAAAVRAINAGNSLDDVLPQLIQDMMTDTVGIARFAKGALESPEKKDLAARKRDYKVYNDLSGAPRRSFTPMFSYSNLKNKQFDEAPMKEAGGVARGLVTDIVRRNKGNPVGLQRDLRALAAQPTLPGPSLANPAATAQYYRYLQQTQGDEAARAAMRKLATERAQSQAKRALIPQIH
jgi:hypothetical protein